MTEDYYTTRQNEHPEDRIFRDKEYIKRLQKHIDEVYEELARDLRVNMEGKDYLFDYVFNEDEDVEFVPVSWLKGRFADYLNKFGKEYENLFFRKRKSKYINL